MSRLEQLATHIREARHQRQARVDLAALAEGLTLSQAYAVAQLNAQQALAESGTVGTGYKVAFSNAEVLQRLGLSEPAYGRLCSAMQLAHDGVVSLASWIQPKVEVEVAFVLGRDVTDPELPLADFARALDHAVPALEIVDSVFAQWQMPALAGVADNASAAGYVLGTQRWSLADTDFAALDMALHMAGDVKARGTGANCLGNPVACVHWLARTLIQQGNGLRAGDVVLSGTLGPAVALTERGLVEGRFGDGRVVRITVQ